MAASRNLKAAPAPDIGALYAHPGFLLRRAHQIAASSFLRECGGVITPPQFSALSLVAGVPGIDAMAVSRVIGLDRTTTALVVNNLVKSGWVLRTVDPGDRRRWHLQVTAAGHTLIDKIRPAAERSEARLLSAFSKTDGKLFVALLNRFVASFNDDSPAPVVESALPLARSRLARGAKGGKS